MPLESSEQSTGDEHELPAPRDLELATRRSDGHAELFRLIRSRGRPRDRDEPVRVRERQRLEEHGVDFT